MNINHIKQLLYISNEENFESATNLYYFSESNIIIYSKTLLIWSVGRNYLILNRFHFSP